MHEERKICTFFYIFIFFFLVSPNGHRILVSSALALFDREHTMCFGWVEKCKKKTAHRQCQEQVSMSAPASLRWCESAMNQHDAYADIQCLLVSSYTDDYRVEITRNFGARLLLLFLWFSINFFSPIFNCKHRQRAREKKCDDITDEWWNGGKAAPMRATVMWWQWNTLFKQSTRARRARKIYNTQRARVENYAIFEASRWDKKEIFHIFPSSSALLLLSACWCCCVHT